MEHKMQQQEELLSPASPPHATPPMTYDEASLQGSRHFFMALQELKNLRPQLYSAAEYCESSYLFNDQKQVVLENLKDYVVKALVNAVDHLGTVAYKLDEVLSQQIGDVSSAELRMAGLAQRVHTCQEHRNLEGFSQQRSTKANRRYHKHYLLPDAVSHYKEQLLEKGREAEIVHPHQGMFLQKLVAHETIGLGEIHVALKLRRNVSLVNVHESSPLGKIMDQMYVASSWPHKVFIGVMAVFIHPMEAAGPSANRSGHSSPASLQSEYRGRGQASSVVDSSRPLSSHSSFDEKLNARGGPLASRSKSLLSSLLGRRRGKSRDD